MSSLAIRVKDLNVPDETIHNLSILASEHGKSLKAFIENLLIKTAETVSLHPAGNPSPSNDPWFDDPLNLAEVNEGISQYHSGEVTTLSMDELKARMGL